MPIRIDLRQLGEPLLEFGGPGEFSDMRQGFAKPVPSICDSVQEEMRASRLDSRSGSDDRRYPEMARTLYAVHPRS